MNIDRIATAGTLESSDIMITLSPGRGIDISVESTVKEIYGKKIEECITGMLGELGVTDAKVFAKDKGALSCVIRARVEAAVKRAIKGGKE